MSTPQIPVGTWNIDPSHSEAGFSVRHLMVSKVRGRISAFSGAITIAEDPTASSVEVTLDPATIDTRDDKRDEHLRSADFFEIAAHPTWTFRSTGVRADGDDWIVTGDLTIRGVTRSVELEVEFNGTSGDPWGGTRAGFSAETEISRKDFGLEYNAVLETGGVVIGDTVKIELEIEAVKQ